MILRNQMSLILGYLIGTITFVAPILGFIAPKGLAPLVILSGVAGFIILKLQGRSFIWPNKAVILLILSLCVWALISTLWAVNAYSAGIGTLKLVGNMVAGGVFFSVLRSMDNADKLIAF